MPTSSQPFKRSGSNSWQEFIDKINAKLENPPEGQGCEPISPIIVSPSVDHKWSKTDIQEVMDKLKEMPKDCFAFDAIPDLWKVSIIEEIESKLEQSWCDCGLCCRDCENCGESSATVVRVIVGEGGGCEPPTFPITGAFKSLRNAFSVSRFEVAEICEDYCVQYHELKDLKAALRKLEQPLRSLESQKEVLEILLAQAQNQVCDSDPECLQQKAAAIQELEGRVADKQSEIDSQQDKVDDKQDKVDNKQTAVDTLGPNCTNAIAASDAAGVAVTSSARSQNNGTDCFALVPSDRSASGTEPRGCTESKAALEILDAQLDELNTIKSDITASKSECDPSTSDGDVCLQIKDAEIKLAQENIEAKEEEIEEQQDEIDNECETPFPAFDGGNGKCGSIPHGCCTDFQGSGPERCVPGWNNSTNFGTSIIGGGVIGGTYSFISGTVIISNMSHCQLCWPTFQTVEITFNESETSCQGEFICEPGVPCDPSA